MRISTSCRVVHDTPPNHDPIFLNMQPKRNLSTTMGHSTGLIREQCPVW